ncbi:accessory gene regulator ArgB-like protein [Paenibacillus lautus]
MIDVVALRMAESIKRAVPEHPASLAVLKHSLAILINTISIIALTILLSLITGNLVQAITVLIAFPILRMASGGAHLKTGTMCVTVTTMLFTVLSYVNVGPLWTLIMNILALLLVLIYAPSGIEDSSRIPKKYYPHLRVLSVFIVSLSIIISSPTIAACFLFQGLTLIRWKGGDPDV